MDELAPLFCLGGGFLVFIGFIGFVVLRVLLDGRAAAVGAKVVREHLKIRTQASGSSLVKTDVFVLTTRKAAAPIGIAFKQRAPMRISVIGASLTREQALAVAGWLREAADGRPPGAST
jgi:hypothetical protein